MAFILSCVFATKVFTKCCIVGEQMDPISSLGDQCIQSDGRAEIKVEVKVLAGLSRINIIDVLKLSQDDEEEEVEEEDDNSNSSVEDLSVKTNNNCNGGQLDDRSDASSTSDSTSSRATPFPWCILHDVTSIFPVALPRGENSKSRKDKEHRRFLNFCCRSIRLD